MDETKYTTQIILMWVFIVFSSYSFPNRPFIIRANIQEKIKTLGKSKWSSTHVEGMCISYFEFFWSDLRIKMTYIIKNQSNRVLALIASAGF